MDCESAGSLDALAALGGLLEPTGLSPAATGGQICFRGEDPIVASRLRLGACIGIPMMACAVGAVAFGRLRGLPAQNLDLDLREAVHHITPQAFWHPTLAGEAPPHPLVFDNPFLLTPYRTADGRTVMACGVYPHLAAKWQRFLDIPPDHQRTAEAFATWHSSELEEAASAAGLPLCIARTPQEWQAHPQGVELATQPVIGLTRIGEAPPRKLAPAGRPFEGVRGLSFTHAIAGPAVGRTLAEQGADVLCATRPNDYEHDFIYAEANVGSRSTYVDLTTEAGQARADRLLADAHVVVNNHRDRKLERSGSNRHSWPSATPAS